MTAYPQEIRQKAINMYVAGVPTYKIKNTLRIKSAETITNWVKQENLPVRARWNNNSMFKWRQREQ